MMFGATLPQLILGFLLILTSLGVILARRPMYSSLYFLATLLMLAGLYLQLSAEFIAVMQVIVYAGAILVIFMFVIVLFQDAHYQIEKFNSQCHLGLLYLSGILFLLTLGYLGSKLIGITALNSVPPNDFGTVQSLGYSLYLDFFFPFEAVILLFLVALVGALYIGRKERA
jgi:NADH-quinone oxidoreductase subunit J